MFAFINIPFLWLTAGLYHLLCLFRVGLFVVDFLHFSFFCKCKEISTYKLEKESLNIRKQAGRVLCGPYPNEFEDM